MWSGARLPWAKCLSPGRFATATETAQLVHVRRLRDTVLYGTFVAFDLQ